MKVKKITAIIDDQQLEAVEHALETHGVTGFTVHAVSGRGKYNNYLYTRDPLVSHSQVEIYTSQDHVEKIAELIMRIAAVGLVSEGIVAITEVEQLNWGDEQKSASEEDFNYFSSIE